MRALILLAAFAVAEAQAAPTPNCADPQSNGEMKLCAEIRWKTADAELNKLYAEAIAAAREQYRSMHGEAGYEKMPDTEATLRKAQHAWIAFRDANCDYQYQVYWGGSIAGLSYLACKADMTQARVKELKSIMNGGEDPEEK